MGAMNRNNREDEWKAVADRATLFKHTDECMREQFKRGIDSRTQPECISPCRALRERRISAAEYRKQVAGG